MTPNQACIFVLFRPSYKTEERFGRRQCGRPPPRTPPSDPAHRELRQHFNRTECFIAEGQVWCTADTATAISMRAANDLAVRRALEAGGVEFIDENGGGPGVRLSKRQRPKQAK
jgi:hypothetical protein